MKSNRKKENAFIDIFECFLNTFKGLMMTFVNYLKTKSIVTIFNKINDRLFVKDKTTHRNGCPQKFIPTCHKISETH